MDRNKPLYAWLSWAGQAMKSFYTWPAKKRQQILDQIEEVKDVAQNNHSFTNTTQNPDHPDTWE